VNVVPLSLFLSAIECSSNNISQPSNSCDDSEKLENVAILLTAYNHCTPIDSVLNTTSIQKPSTQKRSSPHFLTVAYF